MLINDADMQARARPGLFFAGQISGVEGSTESAATGLLCGLNAVRAARGESTVSLPAETMLGGLCRYIANAKPDDYPPTNAAFGLLPPPPKGARGRRDKRLARSNRALRTLDGWIDEHRELFDLEPAT